MCEWLKSCIFYVLILVVLFRRYNRLEAGKLKGRFVGRESGPPPPFGTLKINTDGSSRGNPGHARGGGIGKDNSGKAIFFFSEYKGIQSNNYMEALVVLMALERGCALGWSKIICESDSQVVVDMLNSQRVEDVDWHLAVVGRQILRLSTSLDAVSFCYVPREWNKTVDFLAKWASDRGEGWRMGDWTHLPPECALDLESLVKEDMDG